MIGPWFQEAKLVSPYQRQFYLDFASGRISVCIPAWNGVPYQLEKPFKKEYLPGCMNYGRVLRFCSGFAVYICQLGNAIVVNTETLKTVKLISQDLNYHSVKEQVIFSISEKGLAQLFDITKLSLIQRIQFPQADGNTYTCLESSDKLLVAAAYNVVKRSVTIVACFARAQQNHFELLEFEEEVPVHEMKLLNRKPKDENSQVLDLVCISSVNLINIITICLNPDNGLSLSKSLSRRIDDRRVRNTTRKQSQDKTAKADLKLIGLKQVSTSEPNQLVSDELQLDGMPVETKALLLNNPERSANVGSAEQSDETKSSLQSQSEGNSQTQVKGSPLSLHSGLVNSLQNSEGNDWPLLFKLQVNGIQYSRNVLV